MRYSLVPIIRLAVIRIFYYPNYNPKFRYKVANNTHGLKRYRAFIVYHAANNRLARRPYAVSGNAWRYFSNLNLKKYIYYVLFVHYIFSKCIMSNEDLFEYPLSGLSLIRPWSGPNCLDNRDSTVLQL